MSTFIYILLAFIVGLLVGWFLWGRLRGELAGVRADLESTRRERDRLKADATRLRGDLDACGSARADLERQLREAKSGGAPIVKPAPAPALTLVPTASASPVPADAKKAAVKANAVEAKAGRRKAANATGKDNLRRLIGIGQVNERRLNAHGITTFAQIAAWTTSDIAEVEGYLRFGNRVERERWVEQAQLLAAGNEAEFARRFPTAGSSDNT